MWTSPTSTWHCRTTPPVSTTTRTTSPRKRGPHGEPPSAGTPAGPTSSQSSGSPNFERSERQGIDRAHLTLHDRPPPMQRPPLRGDLVGPFHRPGRWPLGYRDDPIARPS